MATVTYIASAPRPGETPPPGLDLWPLPDFARILTGLGDGHVTVDTTPRRTSPTQQAAWRRVVAWLYEETTRIALAERDTLRAAARARLEGAKASKRHKGRAAEIRAAERALVELEAKWARGDSNND